MNVEAFENLELIPLLLNKIEIMEARMKKLMPPITNKEEVAKFLGKSKSTINRYMQEGLLVEGIHFHRKNGTILVFIEDAITDFRDKLNKGLAHEKVKI